VVLSDVFGNVEITALFSSGAQIFSSAKRPYRLWGPTIIESQCIAEALSLEVKWMDCEIDHSQQSSVKDNNNGRPLKIVNFKK
jgi:hypothetical protein